MGLDKKKREWLNKTMNRMKEIFNRFIGGKNVRKSPLVLERERFVNEMKAQFLALKEKGLGITVFTL